MNKVILAVSLMIAAASFAVGQSSNDYKKSEFYVGYSNGQVDTGAGSGSSINSFFKDRTNFNGFEASGVYNVSRYFGIKADLSGTYHNDTISTTFTSGGVPTTLSASRDNSLYNLLGGVQIKDNSSDARFKPFAHALVGWGHARTNIKDVTCTPSAVCTTNNFTNQTLTNNGFAGAFGGGLDVKLNDKFDVRVIQVDYNPIRFDGQTQNNVRFGVGLVIK